MSRPKIGFSVIIGNHNGKMQSFKWDGTPMRKPLKGEMFLSGAIPAAYEAYNDLSTEYFIMVKAK